MTDDELRDILGEQLFTELSQLTGCAGLEGMSDGTEALLKRMGGQLFHVVLPLPGNAIVMLASRLAHAAEGCEECADRLARFTGLVVMASWNAMVEADRMLSDE